VQVHPHLDRILSETTIQYTILKTYIAQWSTVVESEARAVARREKGGYTLRVVREVRCVFKVHILMCPMC